MYDDVRRADTVVTVDSTDSDWAAAAAVAAKNLAPHPSTVPFGIVYYNAPSHSVIIRCRRTSDNFLGSTHTHTPIPLPWVCSFSSAVTADLRAVQYRTVLPRYPYCTNLCFMFISMPVVDGWIRIEIYDRDPPPKK